MMHEFFTDMAAGIEDALTTAGPSDLVARKRLALESARLGQRLFSGHETVAWCGVLAPFDLLHALGVTSCFVEFVGATLAGLGQAGAFVDHAEQAGFSTDACTYHRTVAGATAAGLMPEPDLLIASTCPCAGGLAVIEDMARHFAKPLFVLEVPYDNGDDAVLDLARQLRELADFVAEHTGRPLDPARLSDAIDKTNRARAALVEMYDLAREVPTPARRRDLINLAFVIALSFGADAAIEIAETYRDEFARKVNDGVAGVPGEQARLLWFQNRIQFKTELEEMLETEYRAAVVIDELNDITWDPIDPQDPFPGMARRILSNPLSGPIDRRISALRRLVDGYRVDGMINPCHWGCRQGTGARGLVTDGMRAAGVPVLNLEVDCVDQRNFSDGQVRTRVEAFMEMLLAQKAASA